MTNSIHRYIIILLICIANAGLAQESIAPDAIRFLQRRAVVLTQQAQTPEQFVMVANAYRELIHAGVANATTYYNMGSALLHAGLYEHAVAAFTVMEIRAGATWESTRNIMLASTQGRDGNPDWQRAIFFWHYRIPLRDRISLALGAFLALWIGIALLLVARQRTAAYAILTLALSIVMIVGSSVLTSLIQHSQASRTLESPFRAYGDTTQ